MSERAILWGRGSSTNVQKVLWTCHELGRQVDHRPLAGEYGGNDAAWFLELNPNGTVPVFQDSAVTLYESQAIMRYLARAHGKLYGAENRDMAAVDQWLDWFSLGFWPPVRMLFLDVFRDRRLALNSPEAQAMVTRASVQTERIATQLRQTPFIAGEAFSIADIAVVIGLNRMVGLDFCIPLPDPLPEWLSKQTSRPGFAHATRNEPDMPGHRQQGAA